MNTLYSPHGAGVNLLASQLAARRGVSLILSDSASCGDSFSPVASFIAALRLDRVQASELLQHTSGYGLTQALLQLPCLLKKKA